MLLYVNRKNERRKKHFIDEKFFLAGTDINFVSFFTIIVKSMTMKIDNDAKG